MKIETFLLTRFNIGISPRLKKYYGDYDEYMEYRFGLFQKFAVPSVRNQTSKRFRWLIFIDPETPQRWLQRLSSNEYELVPFSADGEPCDALGSRMTQGSIATMRKIIDPRSDLIITARMDNDDAIHRKYIEYVQRKLKKRTGHALSFPLGVYFWSKDGLARLYDSNYPSNMFPAVIESPENMKTVFSCEHTNIRKNYKTNLSRCCRMWLWNYHGGNLSNHTVAAHRRNKRPNIFGKQFKWEQGRVAQFIKERFGIEI